VLALDLVHPSDINETVNLGLEYGIAGKYFLRGGYIYNTDLTYQEAVGWNQGISAGAGLALEPLKGLNLKLDYGYRHQGYMGGTHRVTLGVGF
jgi:opacity protein-like surface antigen